MANPEHLAKLEEGVETWNRWRNDRGKIRPNLFHADFSGARLHGADLSRADLSGADLSSADLSEASLNASDLDGADLSESDLSGADLIRASLNGAKLVQTNLCGAGLFGADLSSADLRDADLSRAGVGNTIFAKVDLSGVKGLNVVIHRGPSSIGIDTIYKSKGKIPHIFLRGAGVPENFIEYMASLVGTGIEFYSLFISYSTKDQEFAERLHADLQDKGVRCWFAPHDVSGGKKLHEQIDEAIRVHDKLLLILSEHSMKSEWVKTEIAKARKREIRENKQVLFPIRLCSFEEIRDWELFDADTGHDLAREIREYFIPDCSNWKDHGCYRIAFERLLKDLHGKAGPASA